jgi:hypothetical protein
MGLKGKEKIGRDPARLPPCSGRHAESIPLEQSSVMCYAGDWAACLPARHSAP